MTRSTRTAVVIVLGLLVALSAGLAACGGGSDDPIVGSWTDEMGLMGYEFKADGTLIVDLMGEKEEAKYSVSGGKLSFPDATTGEQLQVDYRVEGDKLIMSFEGEEAVLVRK